MVERPDPDQLLEHVQAEEARAQRGHLRIFFGSSAGVGKTYAMLEAARAVKAAGTDVVLGYVEPHGRVETERLTEGLERLPTLTVRYRDITRAEFDLDAALARHPAILLVDELAHSNLVGGDTGATPSEALAGCGGTARGRDRCVDHGQCPASGKPQRSDRTNHRRAAARDAAGSCVRQGR